ncbi:TetR family transcriptional regulator [Nostoc sp. NIES-3756]|uniref:TniQ family protein n=1 Tax=Nostoc sp. NIES-3756 TaxID=1751286 RepID=UPI0007207445|nr:TniQ family protein [Nostoc sp. NIES-3756]BAT53463.1 TetR family transcriptional regulator [Nostoc sp. NIES-3756]BAY38799.1 TetR family transcriptional regulator [Nostoc sp. NIES-2111]
MNINISSELRELRKSQLPTRSRLYHLKPIGVGTSTVESLTSYITRLAVSHCLPTGVLMVTEIAPVINKTYGAGTLHRIYNFTGALNGTGVMASDLVQALENLTQQKNLHFLTLLTWAEILPSRNLLRRHRAWCSFCYQEWYENGQTIYEPLLWTLDVVKVCLRHQQPLTQKCPHCKEKNFHLAWRSQPGYCSKCLKWLGLNVETQLSNCPYSHKDELEFEIWITNTLGELLAKSPHLTLSPSKDNISKAICAYVDKVAEGNIAAFARQLQVPRNTVWLWCKGQNLPSIKAVLHVCYSLRISLLDFLNFEEDLVDSLSTLRLPLPQTKANRKKSIKPFEADEVKQNLEAVLESNEFPAPSMEEVARRLQCDRRSIFKYFPDLCHAISSRYLSDRKAILENKIEQCCEEIRQITLNLHNQGIYPSEKSVSEQMTMPGYLRYRKVRLALQEIQSQSGR